jgi:hypothetical protein
MPWNILHISQVLDKAGLNNLRNGKNGFYSKDYSTSWKGYRLQLPVNKWLQCDWFCIINLLGNNVATGEKQLLYKLNLKL